MKKFSMIIALVVAIFISGNAQAASWVELDTRNDITTSIDKDSIKHGTDSKNFPNFNRKDGYSAIVKLNVKTSNSESIDMTSLVSFYEKDGERMFCFLDGYPESTYPTKDSEVLQEKVDREGSVFPKVWDYIEKILK